MPAIDTLNSIINFLLEGPEDGPVTLLSHSLASDLHMWDPVVETLAGAGFRVLRYDHRGHGKSISKPRAFGIQDLAEDAIALMDALGFEKVHFCGLSMGGMVGQVLGAFYPERVSSLALCSTSAHMPPPDTWNERIESVKKGGMQAIADATIDRWFTKPGQKRLPHLVKSVKEMILKTPVEGFCACSAAIRDMDLRSILPRISPPTLLVVGEQDQGTPVDAARYIHERVPRSRLVVLMEAAHYCHMEQKDAFEHALLDFLKENQSF